MSRPYACVRVASVAFAFLLVVVSGCAREDVANRSGNVPPSPVPSRNIRLFRTDKLALSPNQVKGIALPEFGAEISLNRHKVSIPPEALEGRTVISIEEPDPRYVVVDLGPDGTQFDKPVEVSIHYGGLDLEGVEERDLTIYLFDNETETWVDAQGKVDTAEKLVTIKTDHFSRYALSDH
jgi:hypothetical protein